MTSHKLMNSMGLAEVATCLKTQRTTWEVLLDWWEDGKRRSKRLNRRLKEIAGDRQLYHAALPQAAWIPRRKPE